VLRPNAVIAYVSERAAKKLNDFAQLIDGINIGGRIVVGGNEKSATSFEAHMRSMNRIGMVESITKIRQLDVSKTYAFDVVAIAQLLMVARNESFHETVENMIKLLEKVCVEDGQSVEVGIQVMRDQASKISRM